MPDWLVYLNVTTLSAGEEALKQISPILLPLKISNPFSVFVKVQLLGRGILAISELELKEKKRVVKLLDFTILVLSGDGITIVGVGACVGSNELSGEGDGEDVEGVQQTSKKQRIMDKIVQKSFFIVITSLYLFCNFIISKQNVKVNKKHSEECFGLI